MGVYNTTPYASGAHVFQKVLLGHYVTAPSTIPTSNNTKTYTATRHSRIRTDRIAASAYDDKRRIAIKNGRSGHKSHGSVS